MAVRDDCRHFVGRSTGGGDALRRCRLGANEEEPFACPEGCLFFEERPVSGVGWVQGSAEPMSNTADKLAGLPPQKKPKRPPKPKRKR